MVVDKRYLKDVEAIMSHRQDLGDDYWTTPDRRIIKGGPFSMLECAQYLLALGMEPDDPVLREVAERTFAAWREDGRFKVYPKGSIFPCQVATAAQALCRLGHVADARIQETLRHLLDTQHGDGGWRCEKFFFGRGPETAFSNSYPTLMVLDCFRYSDYLNREPALDRAVEFLLAHWDTKLLLGPCHYGIGTLFMQVEYPFRGYNLFEYVNVLSFYDCAKEDRRFGEALAALRAKLVDGQVVVERVVPKLAKFAFCEKGKPSGIATGFYHDICRNLGEM